MRLAAAFTFTNSPIRTDAEIWQQLCTTVPAPMVALFDTTAVGETSEAGRYPSDR